MVRYQSISIKPGTHVSQDSNIRKLVAIAQMSREQRDPRTGRKLYDWPKVALVRPGEIDTLFGETREVAIGRRWYGRIVVLQIREAKEDLRLWGPEEYVVLEKVTRGRH